MSKEVETIVNKMVDEPTKETETIVNKKVDELTKEDIVVLARKGYIDCAQLVGIELPASNWDVVIYMLRTDLLSDYDSDMKLLEYVYGAGNYETEYDAICDCANTLVHSIQRLAKLEKVTTIKELYTDN